jgi:sarcosine oxidase, subunit delta
MKPPLPPLRTDSLAIWLRSPGTEPAYPIHHRDDCNLIVKLPMLLIPCPYCGPRPEIEFKCGGQAHVARPANPDIESDEAWAAFLYFRDNPRGLHAERWVHSHGCQRWFNSLRDTVSDTIVASYKVGVQRPDATIASTGETT